MCDSIGSLLALDTDPLANPGLTDQRFAQFAGFELAHYITSAAYPVSRIAERLSTLPPTGSTAADDYRSALLATAQAALAELPEREPGVPQLAAQPIEQLKAQTTQVAGTLKSVKPKHPGLADVIATEPDLRVAYHLAPRCDPPKAPSTGMPPAVNGTDVAACRSGRCQIQVNGTADVTMRDFTFRISVTGSGVTVAHDNGLLQVGPQGEGGFGDAGTNVRFKDLGVAGTSAVVAINAS